LFLLVFLASGGNGWGPTLGAHGLDFVSKPLGVAFRPVTETRSPCRRRAQGEASRCPAKPILSPAKIK